jgi:uncharacterized protein (TIGR02284 family)
MTMSNVKSMTIAAALLLLVGCTDRAKGDQVGTLNSLLRGELAAVETYRQAMAKVKDDPSATELARIQAEHQAAVDKLTRMIQDKGGTPSTDSKVWGDFAKAVEGAAKVFGNDAALSALKQGEQHGIDEYEEALRNESIDASFRATIREDLLPKQREHLRTLDNLKK